MTHFTHTGANCIRIIGCCTYETVKRRHRDTTPYRYRCIETKKSTLKTTFLIFSGANIIFSRTNVILKNQVDYEPVDYLHINQHMNACSFKKRNSP